MKTCTGCGESFPIEVFVNPKKNSRCPPCKKQYLAEYYQKNREKALAKRKEVYAKNREKIIEESRVYRRENKDKIQDYCFRNKAKRNQRAQERRVAVRKATTPWYDPQYLRDLYENIKEAEAIFKTKFHVDHIIPLTHKAVCGLHTQENFQILTAQANWIKNNRWEQ